MMYQTSKDQALYIGDETRDIKAATECNIHSVAVTWGYNAEAVLMQHHPSYILRKPSDLLSLHNDI